MMYGLVVVALISLATMQWTRRGGFDGLLRRSLERADSRSPNRINQGAASKRNTYAGFADEDDMEDGEGVEESARLGGYYLTSANEVTDDDFVPTSTRKHPAPSRQGRGRAADEELSSHGEPASDTLLQHSAW